MKLSVFQNPAVIILTLFLIFSLFTMSYYGMHWDEAPQHDMGSATLAFLTGQSPEVKFQAPTAYYYGTFYHVINRLTALALINWFGFDYVDAFHFLIPLIGLLGLIYFYKIAKLLTNTVTALIAVILLILYPRFLALSQYDIKDISLLSLGIITLYYLTKTFVNLKKRYAICAGISFGLALSIQLTAAFPLLIFLPAYLLVNLRELKKHLALWITFIITTLLTIVISWPTLWSRPSLILQNWNFFFRTFFEGQVLYFGQYFNSTKLPWHYPFFYIFATIPLLVLILFMIGLILHLSRLKKNLALTTLLSLSWLIIPLTIYQIPNIVRYDSTRHYLDIFPATMLFASIGLASLIKKLPSIVAKLALILLCIYLVSQIFVVFPYGDAYFNEAVQTLHPKNIDQQFEIEYWGEAYREAANWLNQNATPNSVICVPVADHLLQFYPKRSDIYFACAKNSNYLMFITRWTYMPVDLENYFPYSQLSPIFTINRLNSDLLRIYKLDEDTKT